jgi:hypothetical protein
MYEQLYNAAARHTADLVVSGICFVGGNTFSKEDDVLEKPYFTEDTVFENNGLQTLLLGVVGALPSEPDDSRYGVSVCKNLFRRSVLASGVAFLSEREVLSEDTLFMVDYIAHITRAVGVPGSYYRYCRNGESLSKSYKRERFEKSVVFLAELERRIATSVDERDYRLYLDRLSQGFGRILCSSEIVHAREVGTPYKELRSRLREICTHPIVRDTLRTYPWHKLPAKQAVFAAAMKYRLYRLQYLLVILRDR